MFDGKVPNWFHTKCFFTRNRPKTVSDIAHFDDLRWDSPPWLGPGKVPNNKLNINKVVVHTIILLLTTNTTIVVCFNCCFPADLQVHLLDSSNFLYFLRAC